MQIVNCFRPYTISEPKSDLLAWYVNVIVNVQFWVATKYLAVPKEVLYCEVHRMFVLSDHIIENPKDMKLSNSYCPEDRRHLSRRTKS